MRVQRVVWLIGCFVILTAVAGCDAVSTRPSPPLDNGRLHTELECNQTYECQFNIAAGPFDEEKEVIVELHASRGVQFDGNGQVVNISTAPDVERIVRSDTIRVPKMNSRIVRFPFTLDEQSILAGEYIVLVKLLDAAQDNAVISTKRMSVFIYADAYGNMRLMRSSSAFYDEYRRYYQKGSMADYRIILDNGERPTHGYLFVKLVAPYDNYDPVLTIQSDGGVEFQRISPLTICVREGGSRIAKFAFKIIEDGQQPDGRYVFSVSIKEDGRLLVHETMPIAIDLISEPYSHNNQWMVLVPNMPTTPVDASAVSDNAAIHTGYTSAVSTGDAGSPEQSPYCDPPETTSPLAATEQAPLIPTVPADENEDFHLPDNPFLDTMQAKIGGSTTDHTTDARCNDWQRAISTQYNATLNETYQQYVKGNVSSMDINHFVEEFRLCNNIAITTEHVILSAEKTYYFPSVPIQSE